MLGVWASKKIEWKGIFKQVIFGKKNQKQFLT